MSFPRIALPTALVTTIATLAAAPSAAAEAQLTEVRGPTGTTSVAIGGINNSGAVAGFVTSPGSSRGFRWNGSMQLLEPLPGEPFSAASDINDSGVVVGESLDGRPNQRLPVSWAAGSAAARSLGSIAGPCAGCVPQGFAKAINAQGTIVGRFNSTPGRTTALVFTGGAPSAIGEGDAVDVTDGGTILVARDRVGGLLTGPRVTATITCLRPYAVNFSGVVVGTATEGTRFLPTRWAGGRCSQLPLPAGAQSGIASSINKHGDIAGSAVIDNRSHAVVWSRAGGVRFVRDLVRPPAGLQFTSAGVNDREQLAVSAVPPGADPDARVGRAFVITQAERPTLFLRPIQRIGPSLPVRVRCAAGCRAAARGTVTVGKSKARTRLARSTLGAGKARTLRVALGSKAGRLARRGVSRGRRVTVSLRVTTRDKAGRSRTSVSTIRLKR